MYASHKFAKRAIVVLKTGQEEFSQLRHLRLTMVVQEWRLQMPGKSTCTRHSDSFNPCPHNLKRNRGQEGELSHEELVLRRVLSHAPSNRFHSLPWIGLDNLP